MNCNYQTDNMVYNLEYRIIEDKLLDECIICLKTIKKNKTLIKYSCGHIFHKKCIDEWINTSNNVIDYCVSCNNVCRYKIIYKQQNNINKIKKIKKNKKKIKKCFNCIIQ